MSMMMINGERVEHEATHESIADYAHMLWQMGVAGELSAMQVRDTVDMMRVWAERIEQTEEI